VARLKPLPKKILCPEKRQPGLKLSREGTYIIPGGLGDVGLEVAQRFCNKGATRVILLSRRSLPPRDTWNSEKSEMKARVEKIQSLEKTGMGVKVLSIDLSADNADKELWKQLETLQVPQILGVVHAAGILRDEAVLDTASESFNSVLAPKIAGALTLHKAFPVKSVDFFVLFSSCGQLLGFPTQPSYANGNSFLDSMAEHRRSQGGNAYALQWTSWHGHGVAALTAEASKINEQFLKQKGVTSITVDEAFRAWDHATKYDIANAVVMPLKTQKADYKSPLPILEHVIPHEKPAPAADGGADGSSGSASPKEEVPAAGPEFLAYLTKKITECVADMLEMSNPEDVDPKRSFDDLGVNSLTTGPLSEQLEQVLKVKVMPTTFWDKPTTAQLAKWVCEQMEKK